MKITVSESQLELIDRVVAEGTFGKTREEVLPAIALEHAAYLLAGGSPYDRSLAPAIEVEQPEYGRLREDLVLEPVTGKALPVYRGEVLRLIQVEGGQCIDFNGYNLHDYKEYLDCGFNRLRGLPSGKGTIIWSGSPRARPMYVILDCSEPFDQYYGGHRCNGVLVEMEHGFVRYPNCQDTFAEAIREYGLTPDDVHDSYNLWMHTTVDAAGRRRLHWNRARRGDYVDVLALFDTLSVPVICGGDLSSVNSFGPTPVRVNVFEASPDTLAVIDRIEERYGRYKTQQSPDDFRLKDIRVERELRRDPTYRPEFIPPPAKVVLELELPADVQVVLQSLMKTDIYGATEEKALIASFLRWCEANRGVDRFTKLSIRPRAESAGNMAAYI